MLSGSFTATLGTCFTLMRYIVLQFLASQTAENSSRASSLNHSKNPVHFFHLCGTFVPSEPEPRNVTFYTLGIAFARFCAALKFWDHSIFLERLKLQTSN